MSSSFPVPDLFVSPEELEQKFSFKAATWLKWADEGKVRSFGKLGLISLIDAERLFQEKDARWQPTRYFPPLGGER